MRVNPLNSQVKKRPSKPSSFKVGHSSQSEIAKEESVFERIEKSYPGFTTNTDFMRLPNEGPAYERALIDWLSTDVSTKINVEDIKKLRLRIRKEKVKREDILREILSEYS